MNGQLVAAASAAASVNNMQDIKVWTEAMMPRTGTI